jgi:hypothetical protein
VEVPDAPKQEPLERVVVVVAVAVTVARVVMAVMESL